MAWKPKAPGQAHDQAAGKRRKGNFSTKRSAGGEEPQPGRKELKLNENAQTTTNNNTMDSFSLLKHKAQSPEVPEAAKDAQLNGSKLVSAITSLHQLEDYAPGSSRILIEPKGAPILNEDLCQIQFFNRRTNSIISHNEPTARTRQQGIHHPRAQEFEMNKVNLELTKNPNLMQIMKDKIDRGKDGPKHKDFDKLIESKSGGNAFKIANLTAS